MQCTVMLHMLVTSWTKDLIQYYYSLSIKWTSIIQYIKKQATVEASTFRSEIVALCVGIEINDVDCAQIPQKAHDYQKRAVRWLKKYNCVCFNPQDKNRIPYSQLKYVF